MAATSSWASLQAELAKKKATLSSAAATAGAGSSQGQQQSKYVRRGDLLAGSSLSAPTASSVTPSSVVAAAPAVPSSAPSDRQVSTSSQIDVEANLRAAGQPVRLFGEDDVQRAERARRLALAGERKPAEEDTDSAPPAAKRRKIEEASDAKEDDTKTGQSSRSRSGSKERMPSEAKKDEGKKKEERRTRAYDALKYKPKALVIAGFPNTVKPPAPASSSSSSAGAGLPSEADAATEIQVGTEPDEHKFCYKWIRGTLNEWEDELKSRPGVESSSAKGRDDEAMWKQSCDYVAPLLKRLKERTLDEDIRKLVVEIAGNCLAREYAAAGDAYVRLAIGNARWPIGVTAVGLHERASREKVYEGKQSHVMHNEESRKFVTILKRLITTSQRMYPTAPSKMLLS
jgi:Prp18 domain/pre-mRNA processing factor 4 (PRP4) like